MLSFLFICIFLCSGIETYALSWNGTSSGGGGGGTSATVAGFSIKYTSESNVAGYRFSVVDSDGDTISKVIDVYRTQGYWTMSFSKFSTKYNKVDLIAKQNSSFSTSTSTTNCYKESALSITLPGPSSIETWAKSTSNLNAVLKQLGFSNGVSSLAYGDKLLIEPLQMVEISTVDCVLTLTEIAIYGKYYLGASSNGGTSSNSGSWGFIASYTNMHFANWLYTTDGMGLWSNASYLSSKATFSKIINYGYGVAIAYNATDVNTAHIWYNPNGGTLNSTSYDLYSGTIRRLSDKTRYFDKLTYNIPCDPYNATTFGLTKTGYTFVGWNTKADGTGTFFDQSTDYYPTQYKSSISTTDGGYVTLYAQWEPISYYLDLNFYLDGTKLSSSQSIATADVYVNGSIVGNDKTDYYVKQNYDSTYKVTDIKVSTGYSLSKILIGTSTSYTSGTTKTLTGATSVNIYLTTNKYYLDLNAYLDGVTSSSCTGWATADVYINGSIVANDVSDFYTQYAYGTTYVIKDIKPASGIYNAGSSSYSGTIGTANVGVYLNLKTYCNVTFNANGGTVSPTSTQVKQGEQITFPTPTREGYSFEGWKSGNTGSIYQAGATATISKSVTFTAQWTPDVDVYPEYIVPNSSYRQGTDIIVSYDIVNDGVLSFTPSNPLEVTFTVSSTNNSGTTTQILNTSEDVIVPSYNENLVYFKVSVPSDSRYLTFKISVSSSVEEYNYANNTSTKVVSVTSVVDSQTEDTAFESSITGFTVPNTFTSTPTLGETSVSSATWQVWEWSNNAFVLKTYGITYSPTISVTADTVVQTETVSGSITTMKSGYGIMFEATTGISSYGSYVMPSNDAYTLAQNGALFLPEYQYSSAINSYRTLELVSNILTLEQNSNALNSNGSSAYRRVHFTPIYYPDGMYILKSYIYDVWTPVGMISAATTTSQIKLDGSIYDDWFYTTTQ